MLQVSSREGEAEGTFEFKVTAAVAAPAEHFYALVDLGDERNARRQLGDDVSALDPEGRRFRLVIRFMSDLRFDYDVVEAVRPTLYSCRCLTTPRVGNLELTDERYDIEPDGEESCIVTTTTLAHFERGLSEAQMDQVVRHMTIACHNNLAKLKAFAEHGVGTIEAFENTELMPLT